MSSDLYRGNQSGLYDHKLTVSAWRNAGGTPVITLTQYGGSMNFQYAMSPQLARELAGKLLSAADAFAENDGLAGMQSAATDVFAKPAAVDA